jgi:hypothetical protein
MPMPPVRFTSRAGAEELAEADALLLSDLLDRDGAVEALLAADQIRDAARTRSDTRLSRDHVDAILRALNEQPTDEERERVEGFRATLEAWLA